MFEAVVLGFIQGLTEFLPISSSGHLVIAQSLLPSLDISSMVFDLLLHAGTLIAVVLYFRKDITNLAASACNRPPGGYELNPSQARRFILGVLVASIPAGIIGVLFEDKIERLFQAPLYASVFLCATGVILWLGETLSRKMTFRGLPYDRNQAMSWITVGFAQALAILPGISRSGSTIAAGLAAGWNRTAAAKFSFFLMMPAVAGAVILKIPDVINYIGTEHVHVLPLLIGALTAGISGLWAIDTLMKLISRRNLLPFAIYCFIVGGVSLFLQIL